MTWVGGVGGDKKFKESSRKVRGTSKESSRRVQESSRRVQGKFKERSRTLAYLYYTNMFF